MSFLHASVGKKRCVKNELKIPFHKKDTKQNNDVPTSLEKARNDWLLKFTGNDNISDDDPIMCQNHQEHHRHPHARIARSMSSPPEFPHNVTFKKKELTEKNGDLKPHKQRQQKEPHHHRKHRTDDK